MARQTKRMALQLEDSDSSDSELTVELSPATLATLSQKKYATRSRNIPKDPRSTASGAAKPPQSRKRIISCPGLVLNLPRSAKTLIFPSPIARPWPFFRRFHSCSL